MPTEMHFWKRRGFTVYRTHKRGLSNIKMNGRVDKRWPTGGDYFGLACADEGNFHVVWVDHQNKLSQLC